MISEIFLDYNDTCASLTIYNESVYYLMNMFITFLKGNFSDNSPENFNPDLSYLLVVLSSILIFLLDIEIHG